MKSIGKYGHDSRKVIYVTQHTSWLIDRLTSSENHICCLKDS